MMDVNSEWKNLKSSHQYARIAVLFGISAYGGNFSLIILCELSYMQASALAGASIFPAMVGAIVGLAAYRIFLKFTRFSIVLAIALGLTTYAIIGSFLIQPVNGVEAAFVSYGKPIVSFASAFFGGIVGGIGFAILYRNKKGVIR